MCECSKSLVISFKSNSHLWVTKEVYLSSPFSPRTHLSFYTSTYSSKSWNLLCTQYSTAFHKALVRFKMSSSRHPRPPSSSSEKSHPSDVGQAGPSTQGIPIRPQSSGSSSSAKSHETEVGKPGPSQTHKTSSHPPTSLKSHSSQVSKTPSILEPAIGLRPQKSCNESSRTPLRWQEVEKMNSVDREAAIIKRANCYTQTACPPGVDHVAYTNAIEDARSRGWYCEHDRNKHVEFPHE